jgi:UDP-N-acetylglucosamine transferase subunit ALG13
MIFLTVGTVLPFDRLVRAVDQAVAARLITEPVFAQIGESHLRPKNMDWVTALEKSAFDQKIAAASFVISHAGMGSMMIALEHHKRLLVMPRMRRHGEHVNDHQVASARRFAQMGCVLAAYESKELALRLREMESFVPTFPPSQTDRVAQRIAQFLAGIKPVSI